MARHRRRLIFWLLAGIAVLVLLPVLALLLLRWFVSPEDIRAQLEFRASAALGRAVHLAGAPHWRLGRQISIVIEGGGVANAAGFGSEPLARWSRIQLGVEARPLLHKRVIIDRIVIDALQLQLQRNAEGGANWNLQAGSTDKSAQSVVVRIAAVELQNASIRFQDAVSGADYRGTGIVAKVKLPDELTAPELVFRDVDVSGRVAGGPFAAAGVAFAAQVPELKQAPQQWQLPAFTAHWSDATLAGGVTVRSVAASDAGALPDIDAKLDFQAPSLRSLLATANVKLPPMRDATTLRKVHAVTTLHLARGAVALDGLSLTLDDTRITGRVSLPRLNPLALRFDLGADQVDVDRYRAPDEVKSEPFELPLAWLKSLDAKGTLRIRQAKLVGAAAKELRIDVE